MASDIDSGQTARIVRYLGEIAHEIGEAVKLEQERWKLDRPFKILLGEESAKFQYRETHGPQMSFVKNAALGSKEAHARRKRINMRCLHNRMPVAAQPVGAVLVGHDHQNIGLVCHISLTIECRFCTVSWHIMIPARQVDSGFTRDLTSAGQ